MRIRLPRVQITTGTIVQDGRFQCYGTYDAFPFNPNRQGWEQDFRVYFNRKKYIVRVTLRGEEWGWKAEEVKYLHSQENVLPSIRER